MDIQMLYGLIPLTMVSETRCWVTDEMQMSSLILVIYEKKKKTYMTTSKARNMNMSYKSSKQAVTNHTGFWETQFADCSWNHHFTPTLQLYSHAVSQRAVHVLDADSCWWDSCAITRLNFLTQYLMNIYDSGCYLVICLQDVCLQCLVHTFCCKVSCWLIVQIAS